MICLVLIYVNDTPCCNNYCRLLLGLHTVIQTPMLYISTLIQHVQTLLLNERLGLLPEISTVVQRIVMRQRNETLIVCELRCSLHRGKHRGEVSPLNLTAVIACAEDLLAKLFLGIPLPVFKKVQSLLLPDRNNTVYLYDLCVSLCKPGCECSFNEYSRLG